MDKTNKTFLHHVRTESIVHLHIEVKVMNKFVVTQKISKIIANNSAH